MCWDFLCFILGNYFIFWRWVLFRFMEDLYEVLGNLFIYLSLEIRNLDWVFLDLS